MGLLKNWIVAEVDYLLTILKASTMKKQLTILCALGCTFTEAKHRGDT